MDEDRGPIFDRRLAAGGASSSSSSAFQALGLSHPTTDSASASSSSSSLVFTLPISCQICLSKVKDPVICSNRHVFCKSCMDVWLQRNNQCPACRIQIDEDNPLRNILGGLSVMEEEADDDDDDEDPDSGVVDVEKAKAARNSKKNLRKARIELLFNEYEEEIEDLREELKEAKEQSGRTKDELRKVKEVLVEARKKQQREQASSNGSTSSLMQQQHHHHHNPQTAAMLTELTAKLQEANDTYANVLKDMDALKKENAALKEEKESLGFEASRLRSRLQLRSPAKMGRYATVAMETEVASARKEMERLKKALAQADANVEKMQREQEHLRLFHKSCQDAVCPLSPTADARGEAASTSSGGVGARNEPADARDESAGARGESVDARLNSSTLSLPDSPSTTLGLLSLRSPAAAAAAASASRSAPHNSTRCIRNLFATEHSGSRIYSGNTTTTTAAAGTTTTTTTTTGSVGANGLHSVTFKGASLNQRPSLHATSSSAPVPAAFTNDSAVASTNSVAIPTSPALDALDDTGRSSMRFSLPSAAAFRRDSIRSLDRDASPVPRRSSVGRKAEKEVEEEGEEEEEPASEVDVSSEPDVQDCLSLMRAAERKILSRSTTDRNLESISARGVESISANLPPVTSSVPSSSSSSSSVPISGVCPSIFRGTTSSSNHSRSSSAATASTVISLAFSSSSSSAAASSSSSAWTRAEPETEARACAIAAFDDDATSGVYRGGAVVGFGGEGGRCDRQRSLKREISEGELPSTKNLRH